MAFNYRIYLFGNVRIEKDGQTLDNFDSRKAPAMLGYLIRQQQPVTRSQLAGLFWGEKSEARGRRNLSRELSQLSGRLPDAFLADYHTVQFQLSPAYWVDALAFETLARQGGRFIWPHSADALADMAPAAAPAADESVQPDKLAQAVDLYRGDFMAGYYLDDCPEFEAWLLSQQEAWRRQVVEVLETLVAYHAVHAADDQAEIFARRWLEVEPWQEEAHRYLMVLLARSGKRAAALAQYDLCRRVLEEELGAEPEAETTALVQRIQTGDIKKRDGRRLETLATAPAAAPSPAGPSRPALKIQVPSPAMPLVNRTAELAQVATFFRQPDYRLLTLVGPGGIGKTRLAIEAAWQVKDMSGGDSVEFAHGVYFIPLDSLSSVDFLVTALADALDFSFYSGGDPAAQLLNYLREKAMLLVLDNLEHLLSTPAAEPNAADLIDQILTDAPHVKILTVSRERLNLLDEQLLPIYGLALPALPDDQPAAPRSSLNDVVWPKIKANSAVQLFLQRANAVLPGFEPSSEDRYDIVQICRLVEGIPLAIELAATWLRVLACDEIAAEIRRNLDFLTTSLRNVPERQRSLRAVFDYSWRLLSNEEQRVFKQLAVFRGGFRREAAEQVVGASLGLLLALIDKSLLRRSETGRFERHHLLWQYAAAKLAETPAEQSAVEGRHGDYFAAFLAQRTTALQGGNQRAALAEINADLENVRLGWQWAVEHGRWAAVEQALESLFHFYDIRSGFKEGAEAFERAAAALERNPEAMASPANQIVLGKLLARQGWFIFQLGQYEPAIDLLHRSLNILGEAGSTGRPALAFPLNYLGAAHRHLGEYQLAEQHLGDCLIICRETDDRFGEGVALTIWGQVAYLKGDYAQARQYCRDSLAIKRTIGDHRGITFALHILGQVAFAVDDYVAANNYFQESLAICQGVGDDRGIALSLSYLGDVVQRMGEYPGARQLYQESLAIFEEIGNQWGIISGHNKLGHISNELGETEAAEFHFVAALDLAESIQATPAMLDALVGLVALRVKRGDDDWSLILEALALALNHPVSSRSNQDRAARLLAELEPHLPPHALSHLPTNPPARSIEAISHALRR